MIKLFRIGVVGGLLLLLGGTPLVAQEVMFSTGPAVTAPNGAANGGFSWQDVNGDGLLDVFIPPNNVVLNHLTSFTAVPSASIALLTPNVNSVGGLLVDINGDGVPDLWSTNNAAPQTGLFYDSSGYYVLPTGAGELSQAYPTGSVFAGMAVADIDQSNYLTAAWHGFKQAAWSDGFIYKPGEGIEMVKGGPAGFTRVGIGAGPGNLVIDTSAAFETWDVHFLDANNDGWQDLLMPSFRHGYSPFTTASDTIGARRGTILYLNDGTGKFVVPSATYAIDSVSGGVTYARAVGDTGIVIEDTVRHFSAIGSNWGDLNNDGNVDLILTGLGDGDNWGGNGAFQRIVVLYGKGDGTFTYKWNGTNYVTSGLPTVGASIRAWDIGDYNNDGLQDVYGSTTFGNTRLWRNNGDGTFTEVTVQDNVATPSGGSRRSGGFVDYNNDGFLDIYNYSQQVSLLQKNNGNSNHWIGFVPVGTGNNLNAVGARFTLYTQGGSVVQTRWIKSEGNAGGQGEVRARFGIGINTSIDHVDVLWPDGTTGTYSGLAVDRYWTVNQGSAIPTVPTLVSPADNATGVATAGNLTWNPAADALEYNVQVSLDPTFENAALMAVNVNVAGTSYAYSLGPATKYYWRVAGVNGGFMSDYPAAFNFTTSGSAATEVPTVIAPANMATNQPANLTLIVGKTADASRYQWQVSTLASFVTLYADETTADTTFTGVFTGGQKFYLRVRGMNDLGASAYSAVDTFTIMTPPPKPTLVMPVNNAVNVMTDSVVFAWTFVGAAASYNLQLSTVNSTTTYTGITDTTYKVRNLAKLTNYTWKVESINPGGTSYFTNPNAFTTVVAAPGAPNLVSPDANAEVPTLPTFVWNSVVTATKYRLQIATENTFAATVVDTIVFEDTVATLTSPLDNSGAYFWRVSAINIGGEGLFSTSRLFTTPLTDVKDQQDIPREFALRQNYPNPFNPSTTIVYDVPKNAHVKITIYDILGRLVTTLVDGVQSASRYSIQWNANGLGTGTYFYRMEAQSQDGSGSFNSVKKLLLMK